MTAFGIDFGTTNSVLAASTGTLMDTISLDTPPGDWAELGFDKVLPTVLAENSSGQLEFGWAAKRNPNRLAAVKRLFATDDDVKIGSRVLKVEEAAGVFFRQIRDRAAGSGLTLSQAVVTIPANSRGAARFRTKISAGLSGIEVLALLNEPTAAAMAYGATIGDGERVLVFDWGGGTLDVTVLQNIEGTFIEETSKGIQRLGGIDVDEAFRAGIQAKVPPGSTVDATEIELAKVVLSTQESVPLLLHGGGTIEVTRGDLENAIRPLIHRTGEPVQKCLEDLGGVRVDHLVMVGGSSKIPYVQRHVRELLQLEPMAHVDPMTAIAEGAALAAGILSGEVTDFDFFVGTEHALGTVVHHNNRPEFSVLIPRNTKLPAQQTDSYNPIIDMAESVTVRVIEGDPDVPFDHEDNVILKEWDVPLEPKPIAEAGFDITFTYDVDGILRVRVVHQLTGRLMLEEEMSFGAAASKSDLVSMRRTIDTVETVSGAGAPGATNAAAGAEAASGGLSERSREVIRKAKEKIHPFVDDASRAQLDTAIDALVAAAPEDEDDRRRDLELHVREHSYLL